MRLPRLGLQASRLLASLCHEQYKQDLSDADAQERAGLLTEQQARAAKQGIIAKALSGGYGAMSQREVWDVLGDQRDLAGSMEELSGSIDALREEIEKQTKAGEALLAMQNAQLLKSIADLISGQIVGASYNPRSQTAGAGTVARY